MFPYREPAPGHLETQFQWPPTPLTGSDISMPDIVPPTPIQESESESVVRIQNGECGLLEVEEDAVVGYLKPASPFADGAYDLVGQPLQRPRRRKGLLIGVKNSRNTAPLESAHNDVEDMKDFLINHHGWDEGEILVLKDDGGSGPQPTRDTIISEMHDLVRDACTGDTLFFQYSGHGGQVPDVSGDESDGFDEVIYSCDRYPIVDDDMHEIMVKPLPPGCRLTAIFDCCSSGTSLDLPITALFSVASSETCTASLGMADAGDGLIPSGLNINHPSLLDLSRNQNYFSEEPLQLEANAESSSGSTSASGLVSTPHRRRSILHRRHSEGDVIMWSSCQDSERSYEVLASKDRRMKGAMTHAFIECLKDRKGQTYRELLESLHETLSLWGLAQRPMMSSAHHINMHDVVSL